MSDKLQFTIYGERSTGTNFLERAILTNFEIDVTYDYGWKHFFGFHDFEKTNNDHTIFIGIIRNPIYWLHSFSKDLHHIPNENMSLQNFLFNEFYSIYREKNEIIEEDVHYITKERYKNIFELRKVKNDYLMNVMPTKVKNYILINYENLLYNYEDTMRDIQEKFGLKLRGETLVKIGDYKKTFQKFKEQRKVEFPVDLLETLWNKLDTIQENKLGYYKRDDNQFFIKKGLFHMKNINNTNAKRYIESESKKNEIGITMEEMVE